MTYVANVMKHVLKVIKRVLKVIKRVNKMIKRVQTPFNLLIINASKNYKYFNII